MDDNTPVKRQKIDDDNDKTPVMKRNEPEKKEEQNSGETLPAPDMKHVIIHSVFPI